MTTTSNTTRPDSSRLRLSRRVALFTTSLVFAGGLASNAAAEGTTAAPPAPKVTVAAVEEKLLADYEEVTGRVEAVETVELRARVSGHLDAVRFQSGQLVKKGDVLFAIDP